jgi:hypothetical protein
MTTSFTGDSTPGTEFLRAHGVAFTIHKYEYEEKGGTAVSSARLGVPEHAVVKTLVFEERSSKAPLIVLMHGDKKVGGGVGAPPLCSEYAPQWADPGPLHPSRWPPYR